MTDYNVKAKEKNKIWAGNMALKKWKSFGNMFQGKKKKNTEWDSVHVCMHAQSLSHV